MQIISFSFLTNSIKSAISFLGWFLSSLFFTLICIPFTFLPAPGRYNNRIYFFITTLWGKALMFFSFITFKTEGKENFPTYPDNPSIIVMNHSSSLDIFIIERIMRNQPHIWMTKHEYTKIPLFSILLNRMHIPVKRESSVQAARAFLRAYHRAKNLDSHIILFPEGRRYNDGKVHDFHPGFALLAKKLNRPVIPIKTTGLHKIFPKGKFLIKYQEAQPKLVIGKPIYINENESVQDFANRVHDWFI